MLGLPLKNRVAGFLVRRASAAARKSGVGHGSGGSQHLLPL
jgi:hypothetical protein